MELMIEFKTLNIGFLSPSVEQERSYRMSKTPIMVNPTPYYLHGYFKVNYPQYAKYTVWHPSVLEKITQSALIEYLNKYDIDILCVSLYIWNEHYILDVIKDIKEKYNKKLIIMAGGPSCDAVKDDWETKYSFIDHCIVGQGEKAWIELALTYIGAKQLSTDAPNIVHIIKKGETLQEKKYEYEFIRGIHYSPYMECEDLIKDLQAYYENFELAWPYETQRGCPYHCTFCDWNGGQTNKTQKRKEIDFVQEIDFMAKNKMYNFHISDANFGMWDVDVDIMKRIVHHNVNNDGKFKMISYNLTKQLNENYKIIYRLMIQHDLLPYWAKLSVQDIHPHILEAIDRPGTWADAKKFGIELYHEFSESKKLNKIFVELILGLPGQTFESFIETLDEFYGNGFIPRTYPFFLLRNAPATYDVEYRKKWEINNEYVYETLDMSIHGESVEDAYNNPLKNFKYNQITSTKTFSKRDFVKMSCADQMYRRLFSRIKWPAYGWIDKNWQHLKPVVKMLLETDDFEYVVETRYQNFEKYKINAMNDCYGKILTNGLDMSSIIGRHIGKIKELVTESGMDGETMDKFFELWNHSINDAKLLDR